MPLRLRTSTVRRNGKVYRYHQLARAIRRDGKPTHEVVAHLGRLDEAEAKAIREALTALRSTAGGDAAEVLVRLGDVFVRSTRRYLDVMVVHRLWKSWGLDAFFERRLPQGGAEVAPGDIVQALVVNRCLAPCSKLRTTEWLPRTVLPEVLGMRPAQANNTRIHRVLDALDGIEPDLMCHLIEHPHRGQVDSVVFLDITDTWFVGDGGSLATDGKCKDGAFRGSRIQIALAVDRRGLPLRWDLLAGNAPECTELRGWSDALSEHACFAQVPLVFDRGFATNGNLAWLVGSGRRFVTCARQPQLRDWTEAVDLEAITKTPPAERPEPRCLLGAGLTPSEADEDLFYVDQGVRPPFTTKEALPQMRVVLCFRRSQYAFDTHRILESRRRLLKDIAAINADLAQAKRDRDKEKTLSKVESALKKRSMQYDYRPRMEPLELVVGSKTVQSFRIHIDAADYATGCRDQNAGWKIVLASPTDDRPADEIVRQYDRKHLVEYAFQTIKSFVKLRPVRHHGDQKIRAHVTLCVLGMLLDRWLEILLRNAGIHDAFDRAYEALEPCRLHALHARGAQDPRLTITELDDRQRQLLEALDMKDLATPQAYAGLRRPHADA